jgi:hypothetical protein
MPVNSVKFPQRMKFGRCALRRMRAGCVSDGNYSDGMDLRNRRGGCNANIRKISESQRRPFRTAASRHDMPERVQLGEYGVA